MSYPISIVIADDHEIFRNGFKLLLKDQQDLQLIGEAGDGAQLIDVVNELNPDVVITDIKMPVKDGIEATKILKESNPGVKVIALTNFNDDSLIIDMLDAGARGYLLKNTNQQELILAARTVTEGNYYYCSATSTKLTKLIAESKYNPYRGTPAIKLTPREKDIVQLICKEYSNKEIANALNLSTRTVESYREKIQQKTGARNVVGIVFFAIKNDLHSL